MTKFPHSHFWFDLNTGTSINASEGSSYHIQHVVRNPAKFGFKNAAEMQPHAKYDIKDLDMGYRDIDHDLEHHVMKKGFVRGYSYKPTSSDSIGYIHFDTDSHENLRRALTHFLPHVEGAEKTGKSLEIEAQVGHKGQWSTLENHSFGTADEIRRMLGPASAKAEAPKAPEAAPIAPAGFGMMPTFRRVKVQKEIEATGVPRSIAAARAGFQEQVKSFRTFFKSMIEEKNKK